MDYKVLAFWFSIGQWAFNVVLAGCLWINRKQSATNNRLESVREELHERIERTEKGLVQIQTELSHMPTDKDIKQLSRDIAAMTKEMAETRGKLSIIGRTALRMNDFFAEEAIRREAKRSEENNV